MAVTDTQLDDLRSDLVSGVAMANRRRARRRMAVAVPVLAVALGIGLVATQADEQPALALQRRADGTIRVEIYPEFDDDQSLMTEDFEVRAIEGFEVRAIEAGFDDIDWTVFGDTDPETWSIAYEDHDDRPEGLVTDASMHNKDTLWVSVEPNGDGVTADSIVMHNGTHYRAYPTCSAELAAPCE